MEIIIIALVSAFASLLTFFSGFGLGTLLSPVLALFFPVETAIALTGIVHLLNNFFKLGITFKHIHWHIAQRFGLLSVVGAFIGAKLLLIVSDLNPLYVYELEGRIFTITIIKLLIAFLMILFALVESFPLLKNFRFNDNRIYAGGVISGFFGGLSGNQGALRSAFLIRAGLSKESFIATGIVIACFVDVTRLAVYFQRIKTISISENIITLTVAVIAAFAGAWLGSKLLNKVTLGFVQKVVMLMIIAIALLLATGII